MSSPVTISGLSNLLSERQVTAVEVTEKAIAEISITNEKWKVFTTLLSDRAVTAAAASDERRKKNQLIGPLDGIPIAIKDNLHVEGFPTFAGTGYDFSSDFDDTATVVRCLESAGAIVIGKCNMDEGALGACTNNAFAGQCINPRYPGKTPGGSSGGSAAAVAAGFVAGSLGTDTMGSVRIPAAYNELWGIKPTQGLVNTEGLVPLSTKLDCIGPIAHCAADLKLLLAGMTSSPEESNKSNGPAPYGTEPYGNRLGDLRIGVVDTINQTQLEAAVQSAYDDLLRRLSNAGYTTSAIEIDKWDAGQLRRDGLIVIEVQASTALENQLSTSPHSFSSPFRKLMEFGQSVSADRLDLARKRIDHARIKTLDALNRYDVLLLPTAPQLAFSVKAEVPSNQADFTALANVAGCPAVAFPIPISEPDPKPTPRPGDANNGGQKASAQLLGKPGSDSLLLGIAEAIAAQT